MGTLVLHIGPQGTDARWHQWHQRERNLSQPLPAFYIRELIVDSDHTYIIQH